MKKEEAIKCLNSAVNVDTGPDLTGWKKMTDFWFTERERREEVSFEHYERFLCDVLRSFEPDEVFMTFRKEGDRIYVNVYRSDAGKK